MFIDTHAHIELDIYKDSFESLLLDLQKHKIEKIIIPAADPKNLVDAIKLCEKYDFLYFAVGVHPYDLKYYDLAVLENHIRHKKCVAVGECGLDYYRETTKEERDLQKEAFIAQIELAHRYGKPLIIHTREATEDTANILKDYKNAYGVFHCFNASRRLLDFSDRFYYGIGGVVTFKNAKKLVEILKDIPLNRLLLETDSPYLAPTPMRGERNSPKYLPLIAEKIAQILNNTNTTTYSAEDIGELTTKNAKKLFAI